MTDVKGLVIQYNVTDGAIAEIAEKFKDAEAKTPDGYCNVVAGIRCTRELRVDVETRRKELKADALAYGRRVDGEAKRITAALLEVETPLRLLKETVDNEKIRIRREAEEKRLEEERAKLEAERAEKEAEEKAKRVAEENRLAEERMNLEVERKALEVERLEREKAEREAQARRKAEDAERLRKIDAENAERQRKQDAEDKARREKREAEEAHLAEQRRKLELEQAETAAKQCALQEEANAELKEAEHQALLAEIKKRREVARPDADKLIAYTDALINLEQPDMATSLGKAVKGQIDRKLRECQEIVNDLCR